MAIKEKSIWLNFDLGLKGNYSELFTFLDNYGAIDCGNGLAYFKYGNEKGLHSDAVIEQIKRELSDIVDPTSNDRIYIIWKDDENPMMNKIKGKFLFGKRKTPVWNGYKDLAGEGATDEAF